MNFSKIKTTRKLKCVCLYKLLNTDAEKDVFRRYKPLVFCTFLFNNYQPLISINAHIFFSDFYNLPIEKKKKKFKKSQCYYFFIRELLKLLIN